MKDEEIYNKTEKEIKEDIFDTYKGLNFPKNIDAIMHFVKRAISKTLQYKNTH